MRICKVIASVALTIGLALSLAGCNTSAKQIEPDGLHNHTKGVYYVECGMCGAHVIQWWYITGSDGELVEVCEYCYLESRDM